MRAIVWATTVMAIVGGAVTAGFPAGASPGRASVEWAPLRDPSGSEVPDDRAHGAVRLEAGVASNRPIRSWQVEVGPPADADRTAFTKLCEGRAEPGDDRRAGIACLWDTTREPGGAMSRNGPALVRATVRFRDRDVRREVVERTVQVANAASPPLDVRARLDREVVVLTWPGNPEPDTAHYVVEEQRDQAPWSTVGRPTQPRFTTTPPGPGAYAYRVAAVRSLGDTKHSNTKHTSTRHSDTSHSDTGHTEASEPTASHPPQVRIGSTGPEATGPAQPTERRREQGNDGAPGGDTPRSPPARPPSTGSPARPTPSPAPAPAELPTAAPGLSAPPPANPPLEAAESAAAASPASSVSAPGGPPRIAPAAPAPQGAAEEAYSPFLPYPVPTEPPPVPEAPWPTLDIPGAPPAAATSVRSRSRSRLPAGALGALAAALMAPAAWRWHRRRSVPAAVRARALARGWAEADRSTRVRLAEDLLGLQLELIHELGRPDPRRKAQHGWRHRNARPGRRRLFRRPPPGPARPRAGGLLGGRSRRRQRSARRPGGVRA